MAGPTCGMMLADMGADVIKVEKVPGGDDSRRMVPPEIGGESAAFMMMNRNKRGIAVDLKTGGGRGVLWGLVEDADVLIENYRVGTLEKLGLGYDELSGVNVELEDSPFTFHRDKYYNLAAQLGGPIKKDRAWFYGSFQTTRDAAT